MNVQQSASPKVWSRAMNLLRREGPLAAVRKATRFLLSRLSKYKSQKGQDRWVLETLGHKSGGYFVDLAASDGITHSNTWALEKYFQWDGMLIEPNPYFVPKLAARRRARAFACAVDAEEGAVSFRIDNLGLGGIVAEDTDNSEALRGEQLKAAEVIEVPARTLTSLLDEVSAPATIDYLSLDVEGAEERVLRGWDMDRYTCLCLTVERPSEAAHQRLLEHDYRFVKEVMFDAFYIHATHPQADSIDCQAYRPIPRKDR
ncbi:MAG: FkbM family methyltransferase [Planctomycetota bacterium]|nr:MAG: FkbM family methyltransferase [Planctomycetota bacterium]REK21876.1 MAG: FkbM family methyltransferase [Planctomycetota bacterium]REK46684.1 MAG: FkbM family methyltransferase [Planctomycetota bacterium]